MVKLVGVKFCVTPVFVMVGSVVLEGKPLEDEGKPLEGEVTSLEDGVV